MLSYSFRRLIRHVEIFLHDRRTCQQDLTLFIVREFICCIRSHYLVVRIRERDPDASLFVHLRRSQTGCGHAFRSTVSLSDLYLGIVIIQELVEFLLQFYRKRIAA